MSTVVLYCWCHSDSASVLLYFSLKLDLYDLNNYKYAKDKNHVKKYTLFHSLRFSHSNCVSPPVKTYVNKRTSLGRKLWRTVGSNQQSPDHRSSILPTELYRRYEVLD